MGWTAVFCSLQHWIRPLGKESRLTSGRDVGKVSAPAGRIGFWPLFLLTEGWSFLGHGRVPGSYCSSFICSMNFYWIANTCDAKISFMILLWCGRVKAAYIVKSEDLCFESSKFYLPGTNYFTSPNFAVCFGNYRLSWGLNMMITMKVLRTRKCPKMMAGWVGGISN
jgi:hypothetical protein